MGVLYARVGGNWVPVIAPAPAPADEVWVGPAAPTAAETELWVDADQTPAPMLYAKIGGNWTSVSSPPTNEVAVQAAEPTGSEELWYDTDAPGYTTDDLRWLSAWGVVAVGNYINTGATILPAAGGDVTLTTPMTFTFITGRRYRVGILGRAVSTGVANTSAGAVLRAYLGATLWPIIDSWVSTPPSASGANYQSFNVSALVNGDGVARSIEFKGYSSGFNTAVNVYGGQGSYAYIEDVGPISGAYPAVPPAIDRWNTAWGVIGTTLLTSNSTGYNTTSSPGWPITALTTTVTTVANRRYRISCDVATYADQDNVEINFVIRRDGVIAQQCNFPSPKANYGVRNFVELFDAPTAGSHTYSMATWMTLGAGLFHVNASPSQPLQLVVEDVGPISGAVAIADPTPAWLPLTLQNSWANLGGGTTYTPASYRKIGDDVQLHGLVSGGSVNATIATLPVGYRPLRVHHLGTVSFDLVGVARIELDGRIVPTTGNSGWFSLDGLTFSVSV